jgi:uncharacterized protein
MAGDDQRRLSWNGSAFRMARSRRRSRRSLLSQLRRSLIEHRFHAAQGLLGAVALSAGLWLLWPAPPGGGVDHRGAWQRSLQMAEQQFSGRNEAFRDGLVAVAEASRAVSAVGVVPARSPQPDEGTGARLAQVARTMPAIGVPEGGPAILQVADLAVDLPAPAPPRSDLGAAASAVRAATADVTLALLLPRGATRPALPPAAKDPDAPTWLRNAAATATADGRPAIAVVIDDLGLNRRNTAALNKLKGPLTLAFLPYAGALEEQAQAGRAAGHELMLHLPMEPTGHEWPGPNALLSSLSPPDLVSRLRGQLLSFRGFVGINNHMGSLLTTERGPMALVMAELRSRGLLFLDSRTTSRSIAGAEAQRMGVPHAQRDVFLDNDPDLAAIRRQLTATERIARRRGSAVAIGHPHDATIEALRGWLPTLEQRGFVLVPISSIVVRESCANGLLASAAPACGHYLSAHYAVQ